jgi:hypothetical protein
MTSDQQKLIILNLGLRLISQRTIESLSENTVANQVASDIWLPAVEDCLRGNNWSFAQIIELGVLSTNYTPLNYLYAYNYPVAAMSVWKVYNAYTADPKKGEDFRRVYDPINNQQIILTNCQNAYLEYTYDIQDYTQFDADFITMLSYRLAASFAMPLNADADQAKEMTAVFSNQMSEAQKSSSLENNIENGEDPQALINARMSGYPGKGTSIGGVSFGVWNNGGG